MGVVSASRLLYFLDAKGVKIFAVFLSNGVVRNSVVRKGVVQNSVVKNTA
jgi:hypothetical protein